jgi:hypothetical protein
MSLARKKLISRANIASACGLTVVLILMLGPALFVSCGTKPPSPSPAAAESPGFEERRQVILSALAGQIWEDGDDQRRRLYLAAVKLESGRDRETGLRYLREATVQSEPWECFQTYAAMEIILRLGHELSDDLVEVMKARLAAGFGPDLGFTENHKLQYRTARYLFGQTWPDGPRFADGMSPVEARAEAASWIDGWIERTVTLGQYEYSSPNYASLYFLCLTSLHDFADDPVLSRKAGMLLNLLLADYAALYLEGNWTGGHSREKFNQATHTALHSGTATPFGYLFFGRSVFRPELPETFYVGLAAIQNFRPDPLIERIAGDRAAPYVHIETKAPRAGLGVNRGTTPIRKYTYMTADYALGSSYGDLTDVENHRWDLTWVSVWDGATCFFINPYFSREHLLSYFDDDPEEIEANILRQRPYADSPVKWIEGSPYEEILQHENAIVVLYDIPAEARHGHVNGFFSKILEAREADDSGWIFAREGRVFFAVRPLTPGRWTEETDHFRLTLDGPRTGLILEAASAKDFRSFAAFKRKIRRNALEFDIDNLYVGYTMSGGARLEFGHPDLRFVDGEPVDIDAWPLYSGPFIRSAEDGRIFEISQGSDVLRLDFEIYYGKKGDDR